MTNSFAPGAIVTAAQITIPTGATVVKAPVECFPGTAEMSTGGHGESGGRTYFCMWFETLHAGDKAIFEFRLRINKVAGAPGKVELLHFDLEEGRQLADLNPKNDIAALTIKGAGGQGGGDGLPITGSPSGLIAGIGGLLLAAGIGGYLVARRRRTRFVA
jgi:LPXTG-motif cell wall-anchored protein